MESIIKNTFANTTSYKYESHLSLSRRFSFPMIKKSFVYLKFNGHQTPSGTNGINPTLPEEGRGRHGRKKMVHERNIHEGNNSIKRKKKTKRNRVFPILADFFLLLLFTFF